ncbi:hypothetical protein BPOR_0656g00040 [Botrytis porri]|uniref:Uncharacterized protein n=1 Tax=Botrytis porri TaxID=87229 RepID=A0A4Z1KB47_9HELO|nr:hypothetical protein BPOR_0656g00040 [Botrytis porri]
MFPFSRSSMNSFLYRMSAILYDDSESESESDEEASINLPDLDEIKRAAQKEYPDDSFDRAFATYIIENVIRGVEFQEGGTRYIFRPNIKLYYDKRQPRGELLVPFWFISDYFKAPRLKEV